MPEQKEKKKQEWKEAIRIYIRKKSKKASLVEKGHLNHSADIRYSIIEFKISLNRTCVEKECRN